LAQILQIDACGKSRVDSSTMAAKLRAMPLVSIRHLTTYKYRKPVAFGEHRMMLRPQESHDQRLISAEVAISPEPGHRRMIHDASGATVGIVRFDGAADRLAFESRVRIEHHPHNPFDVDGEPARIGRKGFAYDPFDMPELGRHVAPQKEDDGDVAAWARRFLPKRGSIQISDLLIAMSGAIHADFAYGIRLRGAPQSPNETLKSRRGSCRDFAVLMMEAARSLGLAARFVSGYVYSRSPSTGRTGGGHTHAWAQVYLPSCGWVDFDPTNNIIGNIDLIRVVAVADPRQALPLHGSWSGEADDYLGMDVEVEITVDTASAQHAEQRRMAG
jgi:transglutaminase-like putative cysteine protease